MKKLFSLFPEQRMYTDFPWQVWGLGWFIILKGLVWLSIDTDIPDGRLMIWGYKHLLYMAPLVIFCIGIWNLKKWALRAAIILCVAELILFIFCPISLIDMGLNQTSPTALMLSSIVFAINWPISNILIFLTIPFIFRYFKA